MTTQAQKTIYRFIRVPELTHQNANTVVLIKQPETTIARVQKINNHQQEQSQQQVAVKVTATENSNSSEKKIKTRVSTCIYALSDQLMCATRTQIAYTLKNLVVKLSERGFVGSVWVTCGRF